MENEGYDRMMKLDAVLAELVTDLERTWAEDAA